MTGIINTGDKMKRKDGKPTSNVPIEKGLHKSLKIIALKNGLALYELVETLIKNQLDDIKNRRQ